MKWVNMPGLGNPKISEVFGHFFKIMLKDFYRYVFVNRVSNDFKNIYIKKVYLYVYYTNLEQGIFTNEFL